MNIKRFMPLVLMALVMASCQKDLVQQESSELAVKENAQEVVVAMQKLQTYLDEHKTDAFVQKMLANSLIQDGRTTVQSRSTTERTLIIPNNVDYNVNRVLIQKAINPNDYQCGRTFLDDYIDASIATWTKDDFFFYNYFSGVVFDAAYVFDNTDGGQYFGSTGQYTNVHNRTIRDLKNFWNIPTDILLRDAHGNVFKNEPKVAAVLRLYGYPPADATEIAGLLKIVFGSAAFRQYNHPLLTFNAFAAPPDPDFNTPKKIVMGDGILEAYDELGFADIASQLILAHEYGHHVQFALNVDFGHSPAATRRTELMADALAVYYLTHKRGAAINWRRVQEAQEVSYSIGDCAFNNLGHHGTPNQRRKAATFGYQVASDAQKQGKILTGQEFIALFDAALPTIVAPDAH